MKKIRKAIIPVAGFGTRFLPVTKVQPKEMLPLVDKPIVHYLVEEAVQAGIEQVLFVINSNKHVIGDYFARDLDLEHFLISRGKKEALNKIRDIHKQAEFLYVHQDEPLGSADAIMRGLPFIGDEPFAVFYADDIVVAPKGKPAIKQVIQAYEKYGTSVLGLAHVAKNDIQKYGIAKGKKVAERAYLLDDFIEKPAPDEAPSTLAGLGRIVLTPDIFSRIERVTKKKGELYLTDAMAMLAHEGRLHGYELEGTWHDCGDKFGFWRANLELGLTHEEIGKEAKKYLKKNF